MRMWTDHSFKELDSKRKERVRAVPKGKFKGGI
jgi:hypothetical protein